MEGLIRLHFCDLSSDVWLSSWYCTCVYQHLMLSTVAHHRPDSLPFAKKGLGLLELRYTTGLPLFFPLYCKKDNEMSLIKQKFSLSLLSFRTNLIKTEVKTRDSPTCSIRDWMNPILTWAFFPLIVKNGSVRYDLCSFQHETPSLRDISAFGLKSVWCATLKMTLFNRNFMYRSICAYYIQNFKNFHSFSSHPNSVKTFTVNPLSQLKAETLTLEFIFVSQLYRLFFFHDILKQANFMQ